MARAHMLVTGLTRRARRDFDVDRLDITFQQLKNPRFAIAAQSSGRVAIRNLLRRDCRLGILPGDRALAKQKSRKYLRNRSPHSTTMK